jgi:hypothetical protein
MDLKSFVLHSIEHFHEEFRLGDNMIAEHNGSLQENAENEKEDDYKRDINTFLSKKYC